MFYLPRPLRLLTKFGRERLTSDDFMALADQCGIDVMVSPSVRKGYYYFCKETGHTIVLSSRISRAERQQVAWHEFAHYLQNQRDPKPMAANYCGPENRSVPEKMADGFAFVCVTGVQLCGRMDFIESLMTGKGLEDPSQDAYTTGPA